MSGIFTVGRISKIIIINKINVLLIGLENAYINTKIIEIKI